MLKGRKKPSEENDGLESRVTRMENQRAIDDGIHKIIRTVCITATGSFFGFCYWVGTVIYNQFPAFEAAIKAFWIVKKGSGHD